MSNLKEIGKSGEDLILPSEAETAVLTDLETQVRQAAEKAWGEYWPADMKETAESSGIYGLMARTVWECSRALGIKEIPRLGLFDGFSHGMRGFEGFCWEDEKGQTWVGLDELWFSDVIEEMRWAGEEFSLGIREETKLVLAEEVCHAYIREVRPELAEENIRATASGDRSAYWGDLAEKIAKEFADLYVVASRSK